jgi:hypothetical protein
MLVILVLIYLLFPIDDHFKSVAQMTLTDHSKNMDVIDINEVAKNIRKTNYNLGADKLDYKS